VNRAFVLWSPKHNSGGAINRSVTQTGIRSYKDTPISFVYFLPLLLSSDSRMQFFFFFRLHRSLHAIIFPLVSHYKSCNPYSIAISPIRPTILTFRFDINPIGKEIKKEGFLNSRWRQGKILLEGSQSGTP
jgi:hypothetical protein